MADREALVEAYISACREEIEALKPGNVHIFADGHGMVVQQFLTSAEVSADPLTEPGWPVGRRILEAVRATRAAVGLNTNLGIILLAAPILAAAQNNVDDGLRKRLAEVLSSLDMDDARDVFSAIAHAEPGGLGEAEDDVRAPPRIGLLDAMHQAETRDRIAWQYTHGFTDIFDTGLPALEDLPQFQNLGSSPLWGEVSREARRRGDLSASESNMWPCIAAYLAFLSTFPDSHIARKFGPDIALDITAQASSVREVLQNLESESARIDLLLALDRELKARGVNPGTSADLTVATLLVRNVRDNLHIPVDDA